MKKELSARTGDEQRNNDDNQQVSPACIKPNVVRSLNHSDGCGIQCISFLSKIKADKIREMATCNFIDNAEVVSILKKIGFKAKQKIKPTIYPNKKYIVVVPSLNNRGEFHFVVAWCKENKNGSVGKVQVYDPVVNPSKKRYVSQTKKKLSRNEFKIRSWTSVIEVCP